jgi:ABC-type dipeptide/oligopeptide/nickel transport system permease component
MLKYAVKRLLAAVPTFIGVITLVFIIMRLVPGDPATLILGDRASREAVEALREQMGLNEPLWRQYLEFMSGVVTGDFGRSLRTNQFVFVEVGRVLPYTAALSVAGLLVGAMLGVSAGLIAAVRRGTTVDYLISAAATLGVSMPVFTLGMVLLIVFSYNLGWFPSIGAGQPGVLIDQLRSLVLPALALGLSSAALIARMTRSSVLEVLGQDFVRTATAKGLRDRRVVIKHVLRNALIPIVTILGLSFGRMMGGSTITETLFVRPGLGRLLIESMYARDYTQVEAAVAFFAVTFIFINLVVDLSYAALDPRIQYG